MRCLSNEVLPLGCRSHGVRGQKIPEGSPNSRCPNRSFSMSGHEEEVAQSDDVAAIHPCFTAHRACLHALQRRHEEICDGGVAQLHEMGGLELVEACVRQPPPLGLPQTCSRDGFRPLQGDELLPRWLQAPRRSFVVGAEPIQRPWALFQRTSQGRWCMKKEYCEPVLRFFWSNRTVAMIVRRAGVL